MQEQESCFESSSSVSICEGDGLNIDDIHSIKHPILSEYHRFPSYEEPFPDEIEDEEVNLPYVNMVNANEKVLKKRKDATIVPAHFQIESLINLRRNGPRDSFDIRKAE